MKPLNDTYMDTFAKDYHEHLHAIQVEEAEAAAKPHPQPQHHQPPPQQQFVQGAGSCQQGASAPIHPMQLDYIFGQF